MKTYRTLFVLSSSLIQVLSLSSCGIDNSPVSVVYEGQARIETYPWLGILFYPHDNKRLTTAVVLVTRQIVLGSATEIDRLPKDYFRARARVILGNNCSGPSVGVRDYTYHPDYSSTTYSALAIVQLETDESTIELRPICAPPSHFNNPQFYAMVISDDCRKSRIMIHKMKYVSPEDCKSYYRRSGLDLATIWPTHTACARSVTGGHCIWRSGAILTVKVGNRWRLLGFGVYGPGCEAPARFLDYGMYHKWVAHSVARIGRPAITTLDENHVILRRMASSVQRFGPCDSEETSRELYTDTNEITYEAGIITYNVSLYHDVEYSCITFKAYHSKRKEKPRLTVQHWSADNAMCFGFGYINVEFYVKIEFAATMHFEFRAYGKRAALMDPVQATKYANVNSDDEKPAIPSYEDLRAGLANHSGPWYSPKKSSDKLTTTPRAVLRYRLRHRFRDRGTRVPPTRTTKGPFRFNIR